MLQVAERKPYIKLLRFIPALALVSGSILSVARLGFCLLFAVIPRLHTGLRVLVLDGF